MQEVCDAAQGLKHYWPAAGVGVTLGQGAAATVAGFWTMVCTPVNTPPMPERIKSAICIQVAMTFSLEKGPRRAHKALKIVRGVRCVLRDENAVEQGGEREGV